MRIRAPRGDELDDLAALCFRSKAWWGYDNEFMELCRPVLEVDPILVDEGLAAVACDGDRVLGVAQLCLEEQEAELDLLFVEPAWIGKGVGAALYQWACDTARARAASVMWILADPGARPFYERMGAVYVRDDPSDAIPGRTLPLLNAVL